MAKSEAAAKAAPRHAQGIKGVPRDARRVCFELLLGLVHGEGSSVSVHFIPRCTCTDRP